MQYGSFDDDAREYVITRPDTPLPWLNYLGQDDFFGLCTNTGGGYTFYRDAKLRRLTRYRYNDIPADNNGRYLYIRDGDCIWNPGWKPTKTPLDAYECRVGPGYTHIASAKNGVEVSLRFFVPPGETAEIWSVEIRNASSVAKDLDLFSYVEFCFYEALNDMTNYQRTYSIGQVEVDASVVYHTTEYRERRDHYTLFACTAETAGFDTDRDAFLGPHNGLHEPRAVQRGAATNSIAHGWNPIGSHHLKLSLAPRETASFAFVLAYIEQDPDTPKFAPDGSLNKTKGQALLQRYTDPRAVDAAFDSLRARWDDLLSAFQVNCPSAPMMRMANTWNQVQCMATFNLSRAASMYETGIGRGMGYRDSNQDLLGFVHIIPERARERILDIAATQESSGACFHQYQPLTKQGNAEIGSGFMDDHLWLILSTCAYIRETGDTAILDAVIGYADEPADAKTATLLDHLQLSLRFTLDNQGPHGLPLIGHADWNDCLNLNCFSTEPNESFQTAAHSADDRTAESLMIAGLFLYACRDMAALYRHLDRPTLADSADRDHAQMLAAVEEHGWDGAWYRRAYDAAGQPIGAADSAEGRIYIESQGWCLLGGAGQDNGRADKALDSVHEHLFTPHGCVLQQPPYATYHLELGEVSSYPPGYKENAGVFCHNNPWVQLALLERGQAERAYDYYLSICPAARTDFDIYRCEPYVYAQMIAGKDAATPGEAKNSWLTGTAAWTFLSVSHGFLGIRPDFDGLRIDPCIPADWDGFTVTRRFRGATYHITVRNPHHCRRGICELRIDGRSVPGNSIPVAPSGTTVQVEATLTTA